MDDETRTLLAKAFPFASHKWRVLTTSKKGDKATWYVYVDARDVAGRLDETGLDWSDEYEVIAMTEKLCVVQCRLTIGGSTRTDVGSDSKSSIDNEGNFIKGAYSDALKRAAVKFGVGRYLYQMTSRYLPVDEFKNFTPDSITKIKAHLSNELKAFGASGSEKDLRGDVEEVEATEVVEPIPVQRTPEPAANGNGRKVEPERELPFDASHNVHENAVVWGLQQGCFNHQNHSQNAYKEVVQRMGWKPGQGDDAMNALLWAWVAEVHDRVKAKEAEAQQPADDSLFDPVPDMAPVKELAF